MEGEDAALPSSGPIPAGEAGAGTVWTSSPCESRAPSTLSWQLLPGVLNLPKAIQQEGKSSLTTQSQALPAEMPSAHHLPTTRSIACPPPYSQEVQTPDLKTVGGRKECPRRAEVLEGSPQSSAVRKPLLAGPKLPWLRFLVMGCCPNSWFGRITHDAPGGFSNIFTDSPFLARRCWRAKDEDERSHRKFYSQLGWR